MSEAIVDRTRSRLTVPVVRTLFGVKQRPRTNRADPSPRFAAAAVAALSAAPDSFTVAALAARVQSMTGQAEADHTVRQAAYDLRKLRGKGLVAKPGRSRRYHVPPQASRTITALTVLRDHALGPILTGCRVPRRGRPPATWTAIDAHYETLRRNMVALFEDVGIPATAVAA